MKRLLVAMMAVALLALVAGCAGKGNGAKPAAPAAAAATAVPAGAPGTQVEGDPLVMPAVKPDWFYHDLVDVEFVKQYVTIPKPEGVVLIDSRPYEAKFVKGYIPTAVSLPDTKFDELAAKVLPADKKALLIFYCEGYTCKLSHKGAAKAEKLGYTNVKVYAGGYPEWVAKGNVPAVGIEYVHELVGGEGVYLLVDSRPANKFHEGSIPSAVGISDTDFEKKQGILPADKSVPLVFFCGGYDCKLSHKSADRARALGYKKVMVAEAGYPGWSKLYGQATAVVVKAGAGEGMFDAAQFEKTLKENPQSIEIIDVRDPDEFAAGHIPSAKNIPVGDLEKRMGELPKDKPVVFVCSTGARSGESYYMMQDKKPGVKDVYYLEATVKFNKDGTCQITPNK
jgi:rhodanese-related sulfurtransferase